MRSWIKHITTAGIMAAGLIVAGAEARAGVQTSPSPVNGNALQAGYTVLGTPVNVQTAARFEPVTLAWPARMPLAAADRALDFLLPHSFTISVAGLGGLCLLTAKRGSLKPTRQPMLPLPKPELTHTIPGARIAAT